MKRLLAIVLLTVTSASASWAAEIDYIESFVLAKDREAALKQLIPGSREYYFYHCLHYLNTEQYDKCEQTLNDWIKRYKSSGGITETQHRLALLTYHRDPQKTIAYIQKHLNLSFNHQQESLNSTPNLPTKMDQKLISRERLKQRAMSRRPDLQLFEDAALEWLVSTKLTADQRRNLLQRLPRPDHKNLVSLVAGDLAYKNSRGFGSLPIHNRLMIDQLDELLKQRPELLNQTAFINAYLRRLQPADPVAWTDDVETRKRHLERVWKFVDRLSPVHNSLKAHVLYHRLQLDRSQGVYDRARFMRYVQLPRQAPNVKPEYLRTEANRRFPANLGQDFRSVTLLPPIGSDERLVRVFLQHFFIEDDSYDSFAAYLNNDYIKHQFAEAKIVNGLGDAERWYSLLPPARYKALKERVDIDFAATNDSIIRGAAAVELDVYVKNVPKLIVKVYEINTANFYRRNQVDVNTDINLDGLVPNYQKTHEFADPAERRIKRRFEFPQLEKPGVYVVDFIGNGKNSRAVVRKGMLRHLVRNTAAGHVFTVLDEQNKKVVKASLWMGGRLYKADDDGEITVPYTNQPGQRPVILTRGDFNSLAFFDHQPENYELRAGVYVDRESLLTRRSAQVLIRPQLLLNGEPVTTAVLDNIKLSIQSTDQDGVSTSAEANDFKLFDDRESVHTIHTPGRLAQLNVTLSARVRNVSQNKKVDLATGETFVLNQIQATEKVQDMHFTQVGGRYVIEVLGKSGEPRSGRPVTVTVKHRDFREVVRASLQTDANGHVDLGELAGVTSISASAPGVQQRSWSPVSDLRTYYQVVHGRVGEPVRIPFMKPELSRSQVSLLELRGGGFAVDRFDNVRQAAGLLILDDLGEGEYDLAFKSDGRRIRVRMMKGREDYGYVLGEGRQHEIRGDSPLQIGQVLVGEKDVLVQLVGANDTARVHVFANRYVPSFSAFGLLGKVRDAEPVAVISPARKSLYLSGRQLGDEYRYIIDRQYTKRYPGNMLPSPGILLNPFALRNTETDKQNARPDADLEAKDDSSPGSRSKRKQGQSKQAGNADFANLDFLANGSPVQLNLKPDEKGVIRISRELLKDRHLISVVAVDSNSTVKRAVAMPSWKKQFADLRLAAGLDPKGHFTQKKQISVLAPRDEFEMDAEVGSRFHAYDSLSAVYNVFVTLNSDPKLVEFGFIREWNTFDLPKKMELYSKHACHELNFFVHQKDREFFDNVVRSYLVHKKDKTFLDRWLLEENLISYTRPWTYQQLNIVERVLLAQRLKQEQSRGAQHVRDLYDLIPPNVERDQFLYTSALKSGDLQISVVSGFAAPQADAAAQGQTAQAAPRSGRGTAGGVGGGGFGYGGKGGLHRQGGQADGKMAANRPAQAAPAAKKATEALKDSQLNAEVERLSKELAKNRDRGQRMDELRSLAQAGEKAIARRRSSSRNYIKLDETQEWAENNYYKLPIERQNHELVSVNGFWNDYATADAKQPFLSKRFTEATRNFTEMMFALSVLDMPLQAKETKTDFDERRVSISSTSPLIVFHEEIEPVGAPDGQTPVLVSQNFFRRDDRYQFINNQRVDKYTTGEFLVHTVYGCQIVVTNPTSTPRKLAVLTQIPVGALPVMNGDYTKTKTLDLQPYNTQSIEYYFYFPAEGDFQHFPVHVSQNEQLVAFAAPVTLKAVKKLSKVDRQSWQYISQYGENDDVLDYLKENNPHRVDLNKILFRVKDQKFFAQVTSYLTQRKVYHHNLWSYAIKHNHPPTAREFLLYANNFANQCGVAIDSPLLTIDPVDRKTYQHLEYRPLVNARAHQLGGRRQILNDRLHAQYHRLLRVLSYQRDLSDRDCLSLTYYMLLQNRIDEAMECFARVKRDELDTQVQYDYFTAYLDFYSPERELASGIADQYAKYPVERWRNAFSQLSDQLAEIKSGEVRIADKDDRDQQQTLLASKQPTIDLEVESKQVKLTYANVGEVQINYYLMDIELLFSRNPFVQQYAGQFSNIRPNEAQRVALDEEGDVKTVALPKRLHNRNVLVEVVGSGVTKTQAYYSNSLTTKMFDNYGQLQVLADNGRRPLPGVYVKVYAKKQNGRVEFYKDGREPGSS